MAKKDEVEAKLTELIRRLDDAGPEAQQGLARALPDPRLIQVEVSDLGLSFWTELDEGRMSPLREGPAPGIDIRLVASSDDLIEMIDGNRNLFSSYLAGHIKVQASLSDLFALRRLA